MEQDSLNRIVIDPKIMVGKPVIKGTRIPVYIVLNFLGEGCSFSSEFSCSDYSIGSNGVNLRLKNSIGQAIIVDSIAVSSEDKPLSCPFTASATPWKSGETKAILIACTDLAASGLVAGEKGITAGG